MADTSSLNALEVAKRIAERLDEDGIAYGVGGALCFISAEDLCLHKLLYGREKDVVDLERLIARNHAMPSSTCAPGLRRWSRRATAGSRSSTISSAGSPRPAKIGAIKRLRKG